MTMKKRKLLLPIALVIAVAALLCTGCGAAEADYAFRYHPFEGTIELTSPVADGQRVAIAAYRNGQFLAYAETDGSLYVLPEDADLYKAFTLDGSNRPTRAAMEFTLDQLPVVPEPEGVQTVFLKQIYQKKPLFSFLYDGKSSEDILPNWDCTQQTELLADGFAVTTVWTDPVSGLRITCDAQETGGTAEWVVRLTNTGSADTPLIENFRIADLSAELPTAEAGQTVKIGSSKGTNLQEDDFIFSEKTLRPLGSRRYAASDGRSTSGACMPYFNVHNGSSGYVFAVGWTGQWEASFSRSLSGTLHVTAGMQNTHFVLHPGESVRTPSAAVLTWTGTEEEGYNAWRQYMLKAHTPKAADGSVITLPITCGAWGGDTAEQHINMIGRLAAANAQYDAYWIDAGWYGSENRHSSDQYGDEWFKNAGDWYINDTLYPNGMRPVADRAHSAGYSFLLWFEPERAWYDSQLVQEHESWFLKGNPGSTSYLLNLGDEEARSWVIDFISSRIREYGIDILRQDFNVESLSYWTAEDADDRQGITEMKYIEGLYLYLDALLEKNPGLILDNCAGGGRRLDYEMLTRALPFWRSDYQCFETYLTTPCQIQTDGLAHWVPLNGTGVQSRPDDTYSFRSNLAYAMQFPFASGNQTWHAKMLEDFHKAQPYFLGSYYKLTDGDIAANDTWYAYEQLLAEEDRALVAAFRREESLTGRQALQLRVPDGVTSIVCTDADTGAVSFLSPDADGNFILNAKATEKRTAKLFFLEFTRK